MIFFQQTFRCFQQTNPRCCSFKIPFDCLFFMCTGFCSSLGRQIILNNVFYTNRNVMFIMCTAVMTCCEHHSKVWGAHSLKGRLSSLTPFKFHSCQDSFSPKFRSHRGHFLFTKNTKFIQEK